MTLDPVTGLYYARNRNYSPSLGRWINQDPAGYINGANTYQFVMSNPVGNVDPWGTGTPTGGLPPSQWNKVHAPPGGANVLVVGPDVAVPYHFGLGFNYVIYDNGDLGDLLKRIKADVGPGGHIKSLVLDGHGITDHRAAVSPGRDLTLTAGTNPNKFSRVPVLHGVIQIGTNGNNGTPDAPTTYFFQHLPMSPQGQIILYGCNSAAGPTGREFIQDLANITDVPVSGFQNEVNELFFGLSLDNPQWVTRNPDNW